MLQEKNNPRAPPSPRALPSHALASASLTASRCSRPRSGRAGPCGRGTRSSIAAGAGRGLGGSGCGDTGEPHSRRETPIALGPCLSPRFSSASSLPPHRAWPFTCSVWARCPDPLPPWTWLTSQHPSLCIHHLAQGGATEKVLTASS